MNVSANQFPSACNVRHAIVEMAAQTNLVRRETSGRCPLPAYDDFEDAIRLRNDVPHGLSSPIFSTDLREIKMFAGAWFRGFDCGTPSVNIDTSGGEVGAAFAERRNLRRPRVGLRRMEKLHASRDEHPSTTGANFHFRKACASTSDDTIQAGTAFRAATVRRARF